MQLYFSLASLKSYVFDLLVWAIILAVTIPFLLALLFKQKMFIFIVGLLISIGAGPLGVMIELHFNFVRTRVWGVGYFIMALMFVFGILTMIYAIKFPKK